MMHLNRLEFASDLKLHFYKIFTVDGLLGCFRFPLIPFTIWKFSWVVSFLKGNTGNKGKSREDKLEKTNKKKVQVSLFAEGLVVYLSYPKISSRKLICTSFVQFFLCIAMQHDKKYGNLRYHIPIVSQFLFAWHFNLAYLNKMLWPSC